VTPGSRRWGRSGRRIPTPVVLTIAAVLSLPAAIPLVVRNDCSEPVLRSAVRDKSHFHHADEPDDPRSARSILYRGCITKARNRIFLSAVELTPVLVATIWFLYFRPRDG